MLIRILFIQIVSGHIGTMRVISMRRRSELQCLVLAPKKHRDEWIPCYIFQRLWSFVKVDILLLFNQLYIGSVDLCCLNYALIALILKKEGASMVNEFRPISLLNATFTIISKVLAIRFCPHIHLLVDQVQSAFTKNRFILNSVVYAQ